MGWQGISVLFYGVALADSDADRVLGVLRRYQEHVRGHERVTRGVPLPGEVAESQQLYQDGSWISHPQEERSGRLWAGIQVGEWGLDLPEDLQDRVWSINDPIVRCALGLPDAGVLTMEQHVAAWPHGILANPALFVERAKGRWEHFVGWCARRGVQVPGPASLHVVADYD